MKDLWQKFLRFYHKYSYANVLWIGIIYPLWFKSIESRVTVATGYHIMHTKIDEMIPFCEYFIVPYFMWFLYIFPKYPALSQFPSGEYIPARYVLPDQP